MTPPPSDDHALLTSYLLGRLPEPEREAIADRLFADETFAEALEDAERDLLDRYARHDLSPADRKAVADRLLVSESQREKLRFARALSARASARRLWLAPAVWAGIAATLLLAAALWLRPRHQDELPLPRARHSSPAAPAEAPIFTALLTPGATRGSDIPTVQPPAGTRTVRLNLLIEDEPHAPVYFAALTTTSGELVWQNPRAAVHRESNSNVVTLDIPAARLRPNTYTLALHTTNARSTDTVDETYYFRVPPGP